MQTQTIVIERPNGKIAIVPLTFDVWNADGLRSFSTCSAREAVQHARERIKVTPRGTVIGIECHGVTVAILTDDGNGIIAWPLPTWPSDVEFPCLGDH